MGPLVAQSVMWLQERMEDPSQLSRLHIAAYVGDFDRAVRLVGERLETLLERNYAAEIAREILVDTLSSQSRSISINGVFLLGKSHYRDSSK